MSAPDPYTKLRPPAQTPAEEMCTCDGQPAIKLMTTLGANPLHCVRCNRAVSPERLDLPSSLVEPLASWNSIADALYRLWLDSGAYEDWAQAQLRDLASPVNVAGRHLQVRLNAVRRCYYWCFVDETESEGLRACPGCDQALVTAPNPFGHGLCDRCSLIGPLAEA